VRRAFDVFLLEKSSQFVAKKAYNLYSFHTISMYVTLSYNKLSDETIHISMISTKKPAVNLDCLKFEIRRFK